MEKEQFRRLTEQETSTANTRVQVHVHVHVHVHVSTLQAAEVAGEMYFSKPLRMFTKYCIHVGVHVSSSNYATEAATKLMLFCL